MSTDVSSVLLRVRESAATLNQLCDDGAESVRALEEFLSRECGVGIESFVNVWTESYPEEGFGEELDLCYGRYGNTFRVFLRWSNTRDPVDDTKAWSECKREDKLRTLPRLIDLITSIEAEISNRVQKARMAIAEIKKLTATVVKPGALNAKK